MKTSKPFQVSLTAASTARPDFRTNYHFTVSSHDAKNADEAGVIALQRASQHNLVGAKVYAVIRAYR